MSAGNSSDTSRLSISLAAAAVLVLGTSLRLALVVHDVESPLIDENEIVEQAVAFMGGDLRFHFLKYGPFTMYVLAGIYHVVAALRGMSPLDYAARVFFEGNEHYVISRLFTLGSLSVFALLAFLNFRRRVGAPSALLVCSLLGVPFIERLALGARIDMPQAAFQGVALLALGEVVIQQRFRDWIIAGACAGLAIATKPLPGLLVAPCFVLASWYVAGRRRDGTPRTLLSRIGRTLVGPGVWSAALACAACAMLGNPAILDFKHFVESQRAAVALHSGDVPWGQQSIQDSFLTLGFPFVVALAVSVVLVLIRRDKRALLVLLFVAVYLGAFYGRASRNYYMIAPVVASCLLIGHGLAAARELAPKLNAQRWMPWAWLPLAVASLAWTAPHLWARGTTLSHMTEARRWLYEHIPSGTPMFHIGWRPSGPRLVAANEKLQGDWGDHFDYGRKQYKFFRAAFHKGYSDYVKSGKPRYPLTVYDSKPFPRGTKGLRPWVSDSLVRKAHETGERYIIVAGFGRGDVRDLGYLWFDKAILEKQFDRIAIFRVPEVAQAADAALAPAAPNPI